MGIIFCLFGIRETAKELVADCLPEPSQLGLRLRSGWAGGRDQMGYVLQSLARILEADAVEGDAMPYREQSPSPDRDTHRALNWFCDIL